MLLNCPTSGQWWAASLQEYIFSVMVADLIKALSLKLLETYVMYLFDSWLRLKPGKITCLGSINISCSIIGFIQTTSLPWISHYIKSLVCFQSGLWNFQTVFRQQIISLLCPSVISELNQLHKWLKPQPCLLNSELCIWPMFSLSLQMRVVPRARSAAGWDITLCFELGYYRSCGLCCK